jgi:hypothetical protein
MDWNVGIVHGLKLAMSAHKQENKGMQLGFLIAALKLSKIGRKKHKHSQQQ